MIDAKLSDFSFLECTSLMNLFSNHSMLSVQRAAHSFQPQMKLEAVDKRSPGLIRVATVEEVETHRVKVSHMYCTSPKTSANHLDLLNFVSFECVYM